MGVSSRTGTCKAEGKAEGLRDRLQHYCQRFGIELTDARQDILAKATVDELRQLMDAVVVDRKWPAELHPPTNQTPQGAAFGS